MSTTSLSQDVEGAGDGKKLSADLNDIVCCQARYRAVACPLNEVNFCGVEALLGCV